MFVRSLILLLSLLVAPALAASDLTLVRVFPAWRDAASFKRISEYFDGKENTAGQTILRTHPDQRGGYYFLVRVKNPAGPRSLVARVQVITSSQSQPREFRFTPSVATGDTVFHLGLTGPDWPEANGTPVAWKLDLLDDAGQVLASEKSYLWDKPAGK